MLNVTLKPPPTETERRPIGRWRVALGDGLYSLGTILRPAFHHFPLTCLQLLLSIESTFLEVLSPWPFARFSWVFCYEFCNLMWTKKFENIFKLNNLFYSPCFYISIKVVSLMFVLISIVLSQTTVPNSISVYPTIRSKLFGLLNILFSVLFDFFFHSKLPQINLFSAPCSTDSACSSDATYKACTQSTSGTKFCGRKVSYPTDGSSN